MPSPSDTARPARLLGDVGGTNARFAWQDSDGAALQHIQALPTTEHASLADALHHYLRDIGRQVPPWCAIGIASPIVGDRVKMTNSDWSFSVAQVKSALGFERLVVINDFSALALALPELRDDERLQVGGGEALSDAPMAVIGPGTGLGVSGLIPGPQPEHGPRHWTPLQGEGGHATLAATNAREAAVLQWLRDRHGHVSAERVVSGPGLERLHAAIGALDSAAGFTPLGAEEISARAMAGSDDRCVEALALFCGFLGGVAGNLALILGAYGGVYIGGGIVPRLGDTFARSPFRARFESKGRYRDYLSAIPTFVIDADVSPALRGASRAL